MVDILYYFLYYLMIIVGIIIIIAILISYKKYNKNNNFKVVFNNKYISNDLGPLLYTIKPNMLISLALGCYLEIIILFNIYKDMEYFNKNYSFSGLTISGLEIISMFFILCVTIWYTNNSIIIYKNAMVIKRIFFSKIFYYSKIDYIQSFKGSIFNTNKIHGYKIVVNGEIKFKLYMWRFKELYKIESFFKESNNNVVSVSFF